jgi:hypothetical protein
LPFWYLILDFCCSFCFTCFAPCYKFCSNTCLWNNKGTKSFWQLLWLLVCSFIPLAFTKPWKQVLFLHLIFLTFNHIHEAMWLEKYLQEFYEIFLLSKP